MSSGGFFLLFLGVHFAMHPMMAQIHPRRIPLFPSPSRQNESLAISVASWLSVRTPGARLQIEQNVFSERVVVLARDKGFAQNAIAINDMGHWSRHVRPDVEAICWKIRVDAALHDAHLVVSHKLCDLGLVFVGDCYHDETFVPVLLLQAIEARHFLAARRTPRGPEVQHHNLAPVLG